MTAIARIIVCATNKLIEETEFEDVNEAGIRKAARDYIKLYKDKHDIDVKVDLVFLNQKDHHGKESKPNGSTNEGCSQSI